MSASSSPLIDFNLAAIASLLARSPAQHLPTLLQGNAGIALFHAYLYQYQQDEAHLEHFIQHLEAAVEATNSMDQAPFLGTGFTGLSWVIAHLMNLGVLDEDAADIIGEVRPMVIASLNSFQLKRDYDLFYGFMGTSLFLAEDAGQDHRALQETLLLRLEKLALPMPVGMAWNSSLNSDAVVDINLGLAHGSPSIVMFLLGLHQQGVAPGKCRALLEQALAFLLAQELVDQPSLFPPSIAGGTQAAPGASRLAWCYGDLGIAYVLLRVGAYFQNEAWRQQGLRVALHAAGRDVGSARVRSNDEQQRLNTGFCHGTAGIAFLFQRLFELTGDAALGHRAQEWLALTLEHLPAQLEALRTDFAIQPFDPSSPDLEQRYGLLEGIAGTGLVLTAFAHPAQTGWSKLFLLHNQALSVSSFLCAAFRYISNST